MNREKNQQPRHKDLRFKESYDDNFNDDDLIEMQYRKKKLAKRSQWKFSDKERW